MVDSFNALPFLHGQNQQRSGVDTNYQHKPNNKHYKQICLGKPTRQGEGDGLPFLFVQLLDTHVSANIGGLSRHAVCDTFCRFPDVVTVTVGVADTPLHHGRNTCTTLPLRYSPDNRALIALSGGDWRRWRTKPPGISWSRETVSPNITDQLFPRVYKHLWQINVHYNNGLAASFHAVFRSCGGGRAPTYVTWAALCNINQDVTKSITRLSVTVLNLGQSGKTNTFMRRYFLNLYTTAHVSR